MKKFRFIGIHILVAAILFFPSLSFAQLTTNTGTSSSSAPACTQLFNGDINTVKDIIDYAICLIVKSIVPLLYAIAIMVFIWGVIQYFLNPNNAKEKESARKYILLGLTGLFVLVSVSGLVQILRETFGVTGSPIPLLPETQ